MAKSLFERAVKLEKHISKIQTQVRKLHEYIVRKQKGDEKQFRKGKKAADDLPKFQQHLEKLVEDVISKYYQLFNIFDQL